MWGYQPHFQYEVERLANDVMGNLGVSSTRAECFLAGAKIPNSQNPNPVCIEPEDGKWPISLFDELPKAIETEVANHPLKDVFYGDEPRMRDKPENIRRDSVRRAIHKTLEAYDTAHQVHSFVGSPAPVGDYHVAPVLQLPNKLFKRFLPLREPIADGLTTGHPSLIHAAVYEVLAVAYDELLRPDPGRGLSGRILSPEEVIHRAAASFLRTPKIATGTRGVGYFNIFEQFNSISSLMYERTGGTGRLLLANPDSEFINIRLRFSDAIPFSDFRWSRKVLEMASPEIALIADCENIFGLGDIVPNTNPWANQNIFEVEFLDHYHWRLSCGNEVLLVSEYGTPSLPKEKFPIDHLLDTYQRLFPRARKENFAHFYTLYETAIRQRHGSMLIVAEDAKDEALRLQGQGTKIEPTKLTPDLYRRVSGIDGSIMIDPYGVCHAIGVILDGLARPECTPSRGARYNSGIRYVGAANTPRLAIIISDDQTVDVIPVLRPRVAQATIEQTIVELEMATRDNYHSPINWLDQHRFYLNQEQCDRVNTTLTRIQSGPSEVGEIMVHRREFSPHPDLDDSYFLSENAKSTIQ